MSPSENPNEYDDERYTEAVLSLTDAITEMWEAGASEDDITQECARLTNQAMRG